MSQSIEKVRAHCRKGARSLLEIRKKCHRDPGHPSDGCGYFREKYCYLSVDCRMVRGKPLCWISIVDHYSGEVLLSEPCRNTPEAAEYGRSFFTSSGRRS